MSNYVYEATTREVIMPDSHEVNDWKQFFVSLSELEYHAPLHVILEYYTLLYELDEETPPTSYESLYYDTAIEIASDDRYPAYEAAMESGFFTDGVRQVILAAIGADKYRFLYSDVLRIIIRNNISAFCSLSDELREKARSLVDVTKNLSNPDVDDLDGWVDYFETLMRSDNCACESILTYYLEDVNQFEYRIFCPLGCDLYQQVGEKMRKYPVVLDAAIRSGLMPDAVSNYFFAALDQTENWDCMYRGIEYLLDSEHLSCFIPFRYRYIAEQLMNEFSGPLKNEAAEENWRQRNCQLDKMLTATAPRGY